MKTLNKIIFLLMIILAFMIINSTFVSATTLDNSTSLEQTSTDEPVKLIQKELNSVIDSGLLVSPTTLDVRSRLEYGSKGEQVKLLQKELNSVMNAGLVVDGSFGSKTKTAVINFQKKYSLEADGIAGILTAGKLNVLYSANNNYVIVNDDDLNVRTEPSANSTKLGTIYMGDAYATYGTATASNGRNWYKILFNGREAYISATYVTKNGIFLDLSEQTLRMYKDGKLVLEAPVITGNNGNSGTIAHKTPTGKYLFYKSNKATDRVLRGTSDNGKPYARPVDYWMPFITSRGIGFHDASWRSNSQFYNKNTYLTQGSLGCVNMTSGNAKQLFNLITSNIYVYVFN